MKKIAVLVTQILAAAGSINRSFGPWIKMQIQIKTLTGRQQTFNFENTAKISEVKHALQEREGIQVDQIRLIFGGKQMADEKTLEDYNVLPGSVIHMVLQLR